MHLRGSHSRQFIRMKDGGIGKCIDSGSWVETFAWQLNHILVFLYVQQAVHFCQRDGKTWNSSEPMDEQVTDLPRRSLEYLTAASWSVSRVATPGLSSSSVPRCGVARRDQWCSVVEPSIGLMILSFSGYWRLKLVKAERLPVDMIESGVLQPYPSSLELPPSDFIRSRGDSRRRALVKSTVPGVPGTPIRELLL